MSDAVLDIERQPKHNLWLQKEANVCEIMHIIVLSHKMKESALKGTTNTSNCVTHGFPKLGLELLAYCRVLLP